MTPEQLKKGIELSRKIGSRKDEIKSHEHKGTGFGAITLNYLGNNQYNCTFKLKPEQIKMIEELVVATAKSNLEELKKEFENI